MTDPAQTQTTSHRSTRKGWAHTRNLAVVAVFGVALTLAACSSSSTATPSSTSTTAAAAAGSSSSTPAKAGAITNKNFSFSPGSITVSPGATVTVTNNDQVAHTVTSSSAGFDTGDISPGQSKTFTAPMKAGKYPYICSIHQYMTGTLIVS
jgi:plastocyanin